MMKKNDNYYLLMYIYTAVKLAKIL